jgi:hypothetical protein
MSTQSRDTHPEVERVQIELLSDVQGRYFFA